MLSSSSSSSSIRSRRFKRVGGDVVGLTGDNVGEDVVGLSGDNVGLQSTDPQCMLLVAVGSKLDSE